MKRTPTPRSRPNAARSTTSSSLTPRITTQFTFTGSRPASTAASIPATTRSRSSRRVSSRNTSGRSESSDTLMRRRPASARSCAISGSRTPLVVIAMSTRAAPAWRSSRGRCARTVGSPPVIRTDSNPKRSTHDPHDPGLLLVGEQLVAVEPGHALLGHAVGAAEIAAVGDREPEVGDPTSERVDQWLHAFRVCDVGHSGPGPG